MNIDEYRNKYTALGAFIGIIGDLKRNGAPDSVVKSVADHVAKEFTDLGNEAKNIEAE